MATKTNNLPHTRWLCKYHIVFTPKYRQKIIYNQYRESIRQIITQLFNYKDVEIIEVHLKLDQIHILSFTFKIFSQTNNKNQQLSKK